MLAYLSVLPLAFLPKDPGVLDACSALAELLRTPPSVFFACRPCSGDVTGCWRGMATLCWCTTWWRGRAHVYEQPLQPRMQRQLRCVLRPSQSWAQSCRWRTCGGRGAVLSSAMHLCMLQSGPAAVHALVLGGRQSCLPWTTLRASHTRVHCGNRPSALHSCRTSEHHSVQRATGPLGHHWNFLCLSEYVYHADAQSTLLIAVHHISSPCRWAWWPGSVSGSPVLGAHPADMQTKQHTNAQHMCPPPAGTRDGPGAAPARLGCSAQRRRAISAWPGPHGPHPRRPPGLAEPPSAAGGRPAASAPCAATPPRCLSPSSRSTSRSNSSIPTTNPTASISSSRGRRTPSRSPRKHRLLSSSSTWSLSMLCGRSRFGSRSRTRWLCLPRCRACRRCPSNR